MHDNPLNKLMYSFLNNYKGPRYPSNCHWS